MEGQGKKIEESLSAKVEEQQKEVEEKLKVQVASLLKDVGELYTGQETLGGHIDKIQEDEAARLARLEVLESGVPELKSQVVEMDERVKSLEDIVRHKGSRALAASPAERSDTRVSAPAATDLWREVRFFLPLEGGWELAERHKWGIPGE